MMSPKRLEEMKALVRDTLDTASPRMLLLRSALKDAVAEIEELQAKLDEIASDATE